MQQRQLTRQTHQTADTSEPDPSPSSSLLEQAQKYVNVARRALESCQQGAKAEEELHRRRNRSGE